MALQPQLNPPQMQPQATGQTGIPAPTQLPTPQTTYLNQQRMLALIDWLLENPSIPLDMRKSFYVLYENVMFGNYTDTDIRLLMSKFREWSIALLWSIPEQRWGNVQTFNKDEGGIRELDLVVLLNELYQLYYINLTRGRGGFTLKELNTNRSVFSNSEAGGSPQKVFRLF